VGRKEGIPKALQKRVRSFAHEGGASFQKVEAPNGIGGERSKPKKKSIDHRGGEMEVRRREGLTGLTCKWDIPNRGDR